jgi:HSP20 family molecular chaperone IbpA
MEMKNNLINKEKDINLLENRLSTKKITPVIKLEKIDKNYIIYIFLLGLIKKEITIKYINDFLIINMNLKNSQTNVQNEFKRYLYLKNLNINNIKISTSTNVISLKIPILN